MHRRRLLPFSPGLIWPLGALAAFGCLGALVPIGPLDFWWHLALGREIARSGAVPRVDLWSWSLPPATPFFYQSWLSEWLFYQLYALGGLSAIVLTRNLLLLGAYGLIALDARWRSGSWRLSALAIGGAGLMTLNNLTVRPQMFSWLLFAATWALLSRFRAVRESRERAPTGRTSEQGDRSPIRDPGLLLLVPLLMCAWVNLHGAFAVGLGLIGLTVAGETLKWMLRGRGGAALSRARLGWLWLCGALSGAALLVNPRGPEVIDYVAQLVGNPAVRELVIEWQPTELLAFPGVLIPLALTLALLLWVRRPARFDLTDALLLVAFGFLAWRGQRNVLWFGMVAWPIIAGLLARSPRTTRPVRRTARLRLPLVDYGLLLGLSLPLLVVQPPFKAALDLPPVFAGLGRSVPEGSLIDSSTPVAAAQWLQAHPLPPEARLFHDMGYGSYLVWALPELRVFVDPRIELYPLATWQRYRRIVRNEGSRAELDALGATHALLSRLNQPELIDELAAAGSGWTQRYADDQAVLFARTRQGSQP